jgi:hypothetical protein
MPVKNQSPSSTALAQRLRRTCLRRGLKLVKSATRDQAALNYDRYWICSEHGVVGGSGSQNDPGLRGLAAVQKWLDDDAAGKPRKLRGPLPR